MVAISKPHAREMAVGLVKKAVHALDDAASLIDRYDLTDDWDNTEWGNLARGIDGARNLLDIPEEPS